MLPTTRIGPDLSRTVSKHHISKPTQDVNRKHRPIRAAFAPAAARVSAKANVAPTRTSLDHGISTPTLEAVDPTVVDVQQQNVSSSTSGSSQSHLSHSASTTSLAGSDSELSLLLNGSDLSQPGTTTINIGSIPITVPIAYLNVPAADVAEEGDQQQQRCGTAEEPVAAAAYDSTLSQHSEDPAAAAHSKLNPTSAEFYPSAYLAAAAATAIAAQSISCSATQPSSATEAGIQEQHASVSADVEQQQPQHEAGSDAAPEQMQQQFVAEQHMQAWQQWQQWQQPMPMPVPMFFPVPVPLPPYMMPAAYQYAWQQQQWHEQQHMHMQQTQLSHPGMQQPVAPIAPAPIAVAHDSSSGSTDAMGTPPPSPAASLPADTSSLMSVPTAAAGHPWALAHSSSLYSSSRPGSSASSVVSFAGNSRSRQQQERLRDAGTVTVSPVSCVKDAAGALAKVVSRHGSCLLLSLARPGDLSAQATHVAAKSLAVARFYVNAHMAAEGRAGVDAAAVLSGVEPAATVAEQQSADEVVFMPYHRNSSSSGAADAEPPLGFMVAKASASDLPVALPPPVGIPACMQDRRAQQPSEAAVSAGVQAYQSTAPLLKAGANTDVNKLSNAIIHNILGCNHVALQLAGAAACHVAMKALIKARSRLQRKFEADIVATASFANEDTSSSIGRSTVFLRLDVMRSNILKQLMAGGAAAGTSVSRTASEVGEVVAAAQQMQPAGAAL